MSEPTADTTTTTETAAPTVESQDVNYEGVNLARAGVDAAEDGHAPGDTAAAEETATTKTTDTGTVETAQTEEEKVADAARTLAGRKNSLVDDLRKERETNKSLAQELDEQRRVLDSWRPILERLDGRPDLQQAVLSGEMTIAKAEATKASDDQTELKEIAEDLGYYKLKADGTPDYDAPDLTRAERYRARHLKWAQQTAEQKVQPFAQTEQQRAIASRIDQAVAYAQKQGDADPEIVREEMTKAAQKNPQWILDNDAGNLLYDRAVARTVRDKGGMRRAAPAKDATEPETRMVVTEAPGGKRTGPNITAAERELGKQFGLTDKDWELADAHSQVRRGYTRLTED